MSDSPNNQSSVHVTETPPGVDSSRKRGAPYPTSTNPASSTKPSSDGAPPKEKEVSSFMLLSLLLLAFPLATSTLGESPQSRTASRHAHNRLATCHPSRLTVNTFSRSAPGHFLSLLPPLLPSPRAPPLPALGHPPLDAHAPLEPHHPLPRAAQPEAAQLLHPASAWPRHTLCMAAAPPEHLLHPSFLLTPLPPAQVTSRLAKTRPSETTYGLHKLICDPPCCCCTPGPYSLRYITASPDHLLRPYLSLTHLPLPQVTSLLAKTRPSETIYNLHTSLRDSSSCYCTPTARTSCYTLRSSRTPSHGPFSAGILHPTYPPDTQRVLTHAERTYRPSPPPFCHFSAGYPCMGTLSTHTPHARATPPSLSPFLTSYRQCSSLLHQSWQYAVPSFQQEPICQ